MLLNAGWMLGASDLAPGTGLFIIKVTRRGPGGRLVTRFRVRELLASDFQLLTSNLHITQGIG